MLSSLMDRLSRTLAVERMAMFLSGEKPEQFMLSQSFGLSAPGNLDLSFLSVARPDPARSSLLREHAPGAARRLPALSKPSPGSI